MPKVAIQVPHELPRDVAVKKLKSYSEDVRTQFEGQVTEIEEYWSEDGVAEFSFRLMGFSVAGTTSTDEYHVEVKLNLPFAAIPFRGMIEKEIKSRIYLALEIV